jgi:GTPase SAR1 family protein
MLKKIVLIGPPGAGKSSIGKALAKELNLNFIDSDSEIEKISHKKISEIFIEDGEPAFRLLEVDVVRKVLADFDGVIWFSDGYQKKNLNTLTIVGKRYYDRFGYLYHPDYVSFYSDNEFMQVAFALGKQIYIDNVIIRHQHPDNTREDIDMTYAINNQHVMRDNLTFNKRAQHMFGLAG